MVNAELLYVPDCPNLDLARQRLTEAAARAGIEVVVQGHLVADADAAAELGMHGSPTILIDGCDVAGGSEPSMSSRRCPHPMRAAVASMAACCAVHLGLLVAVAASGWSVALAVAALLLVLFLSVRSRRSAGADCC